MSRTRRVPPASVPLPPLRARLGQGAFEGGAFAVFLGFVTLFIAPFVDLTLPLTSLAVVPRGIAFGIGCAAAGAIGRALRPLTRSLYARMLLFMLCLVPALTGTGLMLAGWHPAALFLLVLALPLGSALGFIDWYHLFRNTRAKRLPPSA